MDTSIEISVHFNWPDERIPFGFHRNQSATPMPRRRSGIKTITRSFLGKGVQIETMGWAVSQDAIAEVRASVDRVRP